MAMPCIASALPQSSKATSVSALPHELLLVCLKSLAAEPALASASASCRALQKAACDDELWAKHLARDFPLASRRPGGETHRLCSVYRMLARRRPQRRGGLSASGDSEVSTTFNSRSEIKALAARFRYLNSTVGDMDEFVGMTRRVVVGADVASQAPVGRVVQRNPSSRVENNGDA
eukprot:TRINITY_DN65129_c0_g1_i1.p1 TRINITY_DN65129_c0_g1~~TRINITY_DN65129_c0_g1_i1.p1  ORF type:complete len:176 (+),score=17.98 TRINITY_DN65129_c0_g1_i1:63-590(+)